MVSVKTRPPRTRSGGSREWCSPSQLASRHTSAEWSRDHASSRSVSPEPQGESHQRSVSAQRYSPAAVGRSPSSPVNDGAARGLSPLATSSQPLFLSAGAEPISHQAACQGLASEHSTSEVSPTSPAGVFLSKSLPVMKHVASSDRLLSVAASADALISRSISVEQVELAGFRPFASTWNPRQVSAWLLACNFDELRAALGYNTLDGAGLCALTSLEALEPYGLRDHPRAAEFVDQVSELTLLTLSEDGRQPLPFVEGEPSPLICDNWHHVDHQRFALKRTVLVLLSELSREERLPARTLSSQRV